MLSVGVSFTTACTPGIYMALMLCMLRTRSSAAALLSAVIAQARSLAAVQTYATFHENDLYKQGAPLTAYSGVVAALLGKQGRGLIARHSCDQGDLVMSVQPASLVQGPADEEPDPEYLVPALLEASQQPQVLAALQGLYDGTDTQQQHLPDLAVLAMAQPREASSCCPDHGHGHDHSHTHEHSHHQHSHSPLPPNKPNSDADAGLSSSNQPLSLEHASQLVRFNAFADAFEDLAAAALRGAAEPHSIAGCWPAFALFNHSCSPNTVHYVVGTSMVARATEDVPAGQELTVSYLGREDFAPAGARQAVLQERFGFKCTCERCRLEQRAPEALQQLVEETFKLVHQDLKPAFMQAVEQQDASSLSHVSAALQEQEDQMAAALQQHLAALGPSAVLVMQAAVYDLYELLLFAEQLGAGSAAEEAHRSLARLGRCIAIANCVARGSELHVFLTSRMLRHALDLRGPDSPQAEAAAALVQEAHLLRYGKAVSQEVLLGLMEANAQAAQDFLM